MKAPLDYESKSARRRKPLIPPNQSWAGVASLVPSAILVLLTLYLVALFIWPPGYFAGSAFGGTICLAVPVTLLSLMLALLGCAEYDRDWTLAKWSLWSIGVCWLTGVLGVAISRWLRA